MGKQPKTKRMYVDNERFLAEIVKYKEMCADALKEGKDKPRIPEYVGECVYKIAVGLSSKPRFNNYSFKEEMISDSIENCFHRSTKIMTIEHGPIDIERIVGQEVTVKARDGIWRKALVKSYGKQMLYEYGFGARNKSNENIVQKVICTKNHRWFLRSRLNKKKMFDWKNEVVTDLRVGDMLENAVYITQRDNNAIIHGILFGDGSVNNKSIYADNLVIRQGRDYAFMRVCKQDFVKDEIIEHFKNAGYHCTYPKSAGGDPVYYCGRFPHCKEVPFGYDPSYIAGFIYGWWLADGTKKTIDGQLIISTCNKEAAEWLCDHCAYGGYHLLSLRIKDGAGYVNGKPLYIITLGHDEYYKPRVKYMKEWGEDEVFCLEEPVTKSFVLANGLLTGNCILYFDNFDPKVGLNPFAYFTQIIYFAFHRRILKEEKNRYVIYKSFQESCSMQDDTLMVDYDDKVLTGPTIYDNINDFIGNFERREREKKIKRKEAKKGLEKFIKTDIEGEK